MAVHPILKIINWAIPEQQILGQWEGDFPIPAVEKSLYFEAVLLAFYKKFRTNSVQKRTFLISINMWQILEKQ